ncbi:MAG: prepilin-type N-terminal cleavage/methylation domain-containing protein [Solirubrobacteraceae bacterium]|nr:prepilin-type N-terminal cleavage/methylation domain-containing protein [Solirubrobacteraceae bacterium]
MAKIVDTHRREDGFTLVELLVAISISLVVLLATLSSLDLFSSNAAHQTRVTDANEQVRTMVDRTVRDLRGASMILRAEAKDLAYAVPESGGARIERLCVTSDDLYGSSQFTTTTPLTAPTAACSSGTKLANLRSTTNTAFTYDGASTSPTADTRALVRNVGIIFSLEASSGGKTSSSTLQASAARRAAGALAVTDDDLDVTCGSTGALLSLSADIPAVGAVTVTYANDGGIAIGTPVTGGVLIPPGLTQIVATITDALGVTNTIRKDVECN